RAPFIAEPAYRGVFDTAQWVSPSPVRPLVRIDVTPNEFPFLDSVVSHRDRDPGFFVYARTIARQRSVRRQTKRPACHASSTPADLLSTSPASRPICCTVAKSRSVSIFDAFFGHATHRPSAGASVCFRAVKRRFSSTREVVNRTTTSTPGVAPSFFDSGV